jgi:GMP synthase-like glutamine amidotransferase
MDIGILETGRPPGDLAAAHGDYPAMFRDLLGPGFDITVYDVAAGELPPAPGVHSAYLITGSPAGVYEDHPWIEPLKAFLRETRGEAKMVGICFGHQIMAEAFGGRVAKSAKGWGIGLQRYELAATAPWTDGDSAGNVFAIPASHQDQIEALPPGAEVIARSAFTPYAGLAYGDTAISFQAHPEFSPDFAKALIGARRDRLPEADAAIASLDAPNDRALVAGWIRRFLGQ